MNHNRFNRLKNFLNGLLGFHYASSRLAGQPLVLAQGAILFCLNGSMMALGRLEPLSFIPGMFFRFASYFVTLFGGFGFVPNDPAMALVSVLLMNALGAIYAWLTATLGGRAHAKPEPRAEVPVALPSP